MVFICQQTTVRQALWRACWTHPGSQTSSSLTMRTHGNPGDRSSRQGCNPAGESPAASVARVGCEAIPQPGAGNRTGKLRGVNGPVAMEREASSVGAIWGPSERGSPNISECLQPRNGYPVEVALRESFRSAERVISSVRPMSSGKKRASAPMEHGGVGGPSTYVRIAEITSGTTPFSSGSRLPAKTGAQSYKQRAPENGGRAHESVGAMTVWVMPAEVAIDVTLQEVTPSGGKGTLGHDGGFDRHPRGTSRSTMVGQQDKPQRWVANPG